MTEIRRRGRPRRHETPLTEVVEGLNNAFDATVKDVAETQVAPVADAAPTPRRRRASTGGLHKKLDTPPPPPGMMYRWFNDVPGRLEYAEDLAYDHVTDPSIRSDNQGGPVRRVVGTHPSGQPLHAYLMKTPVTEWERGQAEREETHRLVDTAINEGRDATGRVQDAYGEGSIRAR
jgi:hypothetical protein